MEEPRPKSIKTIGTVVAVFSGFIIFSNGMGALFWTIFGMGDELSSPDTMNTEPFSFLLTHYVEMCTMMLCLGIAYLIGGIFISKYKLWANRMVSGISVLLILVIWGIMVMISMLCSQQEGLEIFVFGALFNALLWSTPLGLLIWFLNRPKIKKHFS
ncbi:hypothetical protein LAG90_08970 [Marinilongibacter aquaticus]|uniref:hypothetical protein n=1 Tax=Marinilongibacter aquaticus TaxID=2975157 RepID=UPI0021BDA9F8|nr:hypothetical protein [Marinilongibacter aquaticus]UBM60765.1 hypothetical protein LAG90_08970 [Marinilongibacter aquaticus]